MALIEVRDLTKTYDLGEVKVRALRGVSFDLDAGEYVALIGPSGSGKSTLMNTLGCLDRPTSGSYVLSGQEVTTMTPRQRAKIRNREIGFVFQNFNLLNRTSARDNVELPLLYASKRSASERSKQVRALMERVGLGDRMEHHPGQLSGGQQQRVAIARALVNDPSILLADEPTGNLDSETSREVIQIIRNLNEEQGITIVLVTHDLNVAQNADRSIVLHDGDVVADTSDFEQAHEALRVAGHEVAQARQNLT